MPFKCISMCDWGLDRRELHDICRNMLRQDKWKIIAEFETHSCGFHEFKMTINHSVRVGVCFFFTLFNFVVKPLKIPASVVTIGLSLWVMSLLSWRRTLNESYIALGSEGYFINEDCTLSQVKSSLKRQGTAFEATHFYNTEISGFSPTLDNTFTV